MRGMIEVLTKDKLYFHEYPFILDKISKITLWNTELDNKSRDIMLEEFLRWA